MHGKIKGNKLEKFILKININVDTRIILELIDFFIKIEEISLLIFLKIIFNIILKRDGVIQNLDGKIMSVIIIEYQLSEINDVVGSKDEKRLVIIINY